MANVDARITITADSRPAEREIERLGNQIARVQRSAFIPVDDLIRVGSVQKSIQTINQLENAVVSLRSQIRSISAPGGGGGLGDALGDSIRVAATAANTFFDSLASGQRSLSNTVSGLREQSGAFAALAANISSADARFTDYIQGAQAAQDKGLRPLFNQFRALQRLYEEGITGRGVEITSGEVGANFFERLSREIPQTEGALKAFSAELQRVRSLISSESTSALGIEQLMLQTEQQLLRIEENRLQVRAAISRELSAPVQASLSRAEGAGPNPFGISGEQINDSLNQRAEQYQQNLEEIARVTQSLASMEGKKYDPLGISDEQVNAGLNERASRLVQQRDELGSLQQVLSAMESKKYDPLNISDQQINAGLNERASLYQRQVKELADLQAILGAMQGRKVDPLGISDEQVNATLNQRADIFEKQTRDMEALQGALGSLESRRVNWATALGISEADIAADGAQRLAREWERLQAEADGIAAKAPEAAAALKAFKFESLSESADSYTRALLNQQRTLDEYTGAANRAASAVKELGYGGELPALRPAGFTNQDVRMKNLVDDQIKSADIVADYERKAEVLINDLEIGNIQRQLDAELDSIQVTLDARKKAGDAWWRKEKALLDQKTAIQDQQAKQSRLPFLEQRFGKRGSAAISEGLIGGAFPLLFGQGAGASAGGLAGGVAGGFAGGGLGFGLSLIGTAVGTAFDTAVQSATELGAALVDTSKTFDLVKDRALFSSKETEKLATKLSEMGFAASASILAQQEIINKVGATGYRSLMDLANASDEATRAWGEFNLQLQAALAGPMAGLLEWVTDILKLRNQRSESRRLVGEVSSGLSGETKKKFDREIEAISYQGLTMDEAAKQKAALAESYKPLAKPVEVEVKPVLTDKQKIEQELASLGKSLEALDAGKSLKDAVRQAAREQQDLDKQRADLVRSYEESIGNIRKQIEDEVSRRRFSILEKENQLLDLQGENRIKQLEAANAQTIALAGRGERGEVAGVAREVAQIVAEFTEQQLSAEEEAAKIKRNAALDARKLDFEAGQFKANIEKEVARLNIETARQVAGINEGVRRRNEETDSRRFSIEKSIAILKMQLFQDELATMSVRPNLSEPDKRLMSEGYTALESNINYVKTLGPPATLQEVGQVGGAGAPTTNFDAIASREKSAIQALVGESLRGIDFAVKGSREALARTLLDVTDGIDQSLKDIETREADAEANRLRRIELINAGLTEGVAQRVMELEQLKGIALAQYDAAILQAQGKIIQDATTAAQLATNAALVEEIKLIKERKAALEGKFGTFDTTTGTGAGAIGGTATSGRGNEIQEFITKATSELNNLEAVAVRVSQSIGDAIGNSLAAGISGLIEGTTSAKEVFANFLKDISQILLGEATKMIATYIAIGIAKAFAGLGSKSLGFGGASDPLGAGGAFWNAKGNAFAANGIVPFANGGAFTNSIVSSPTLFQFADGGVTRMGEMGEAGPEAIMPLKRGPDGRLGVDASGMAVPYRRSTAAADPAMEVPYRRSTATADSALEVPYRRSEPALAVPYRKAAGSAADGGGAMAIDNEPIRFESVVINSVEYVTRDEAEAIGVRSEQRGADLAHKRYCNNPSYRAAAGFNR